MIQEIQIRNFNIIEKAQVTFHEGFHALSGETGAGKSFLVQAIAFALGTRFDAESVRAGAEEAAVTICFEKMDSTPVFQRCRELGIDLQTSEGQLCLRRTMNTAGRSRAYVNDQAVTLKTLQLLGGLLVQRVGQHAAQQLMDELFLLQLLDRFAGNEDLLASYQRNLKNYHQEKDALLRLNERISESGEQEEFFRFQCRELEEARLREGEEEELESQKQRLKHRVTLANQTFEMGQLLREGEDNVTGRLGRVLHLMEKARGLDASLERWIAPLREALGKVEVAGRGLEEYGRELQEEPESFDRLESRLAQIQELKRKYRMGEADLIAKLAELKMKLSELEDFESILQEQKRKLGETEDQLKKSAEALGVRRRKCSQEISVLLKRKLKALALPHASIEWLLEPLPASEDFKSHGGDSLKLLVSFNPGEEMRPFQEVISGGELSRLLLAIYEVLYPGTMFGTFVFDEVDAGVSGGVAELIGRKLHALGNETQVLCVTHLPQIACQARWHYAVEKQVRGGRTFSEIRQLGSEERVQEIARMLAGVKVTSQAMKHARELLGIHAA